MKTYKTSWLGMAIGMVIMLLILPQPANAALTLGANSITSDADLNVNSSAVFSGTLGLGGSAVSPQRMVNIDISGAPTTGITGVYSKLAFTNAQDAIAGWFEVSNTATTDSSAAITGIVVKATDNSVNSGYTTVGSDIYVTTGTGSVTNFNAVVEGNLTHAGYSNTVYGGDFNLLNHGSTPQLFGVNSAITNTTASATAGTTSLFRGKLTNTSSGSISSLRGLDLSGWSNSATVTDSYGIYIDNSINLGATTKYAIYSAATSQSYLQGNLGIGIAVPTAKLEVKDGHFASSQTTLPTGSVTGVGYSGGSLGANSTDTKGSISGTVAASAAGTMVVTFNSDYATAPTCVATAANSAAQVDGAKMYVTSTIHALTLNFASTTTGGSETWNYICMQ